MIDRGSRAGDGGRDAHGVKWWVVPNSVGPMLGVNAPHRNWKFGNALYAHCEGFEGFEGFESAVAANQMASAGATT